MNKVKYVVTIEMELDPNEVVETTRIGLPSRWNYTSLLSAGGYDVTASVASAYEACCESYVEWVTDDPDRRYPEKNFTPYFHDEGCRHFVDIESDDDETSTAELDVIFGDVAGQLNDLTIRPESEVK